MAARIANLEEMAAATAQGDMEAADDAMEMAAPVAGGEVGRGVGSSSSTGRPGDSIRCSADGSSS